MRVGSLDLEPEERRIVERRLVVVDLVGFFSAGCAAIALVLTVLG